MGHPVVIAAFLIGMIAIGGLVYYAYTIYENSQNILPTTPNPFRNNQPYVSINYIQTCDCASFNMSLTDHGYTAITMYGSVEAFHITVNGNTYALFSFDSPECIANGATVNVSVSSTTVTVPSGSSYQLSFKGYSSTANCSSILDTSGSLNVRWTQLPSPYIAISYKGDCEHIMFNISNPCVTFLSNNLNETNFKANVTLVDHGYNCLRIPSSFDITIDGVSYNFYSFSSVTTLSNGGNVTITGYGNVQFADWQTYQLSIVPTTCNYNNVAVRYTH